MKPTRNTPPDADLDFEAVALRQSAMVEAGTHPMIADRLARHATRAQGLRDAHLQQTATTVQEPVLATEPAVSTQTVPAGEPGTPELHA